MLGLKLNHVSKRGHRLPQLGNEDRCDARIVTFQGPVLPQAFQPMAVQLSKKAALPLAKILTTMSCRSSKTGPRAWGRWADLMATKIPYLPHKINFMCLPYLPHNINSMCLWNIPFIPLSVEITLWAPHPLPIYRPMINSSSSDPVCILGLYSLSGQTSYCKISWSLEARIFRFRLQQSLWNLTATSTVALPRCLSNFRVIRSLQHQMSQLRVFTRFGSKMSYCLWIEDLNFVIMMPAKVLTLNGAGPSADTLNTKSLTWF